MNKKIILIFFCCVPGLTYSLKDLSLPKGYNFQPATLQALQHIQEELNANSLSLQILHHYQPLSNQLKKRPDRLILCVAALDQMTQNHGLKRELLSALLQCSGFVQKDNGQWISYNNPKRADRFRVEGVYRLQ